MPHLRHSPTAARPSQVKSTFRMSAVRPPEATPPARPGMPPEGVLAVVCLDNPRDNTRGKAVWTALPSPGPQEECPWRLSDVTRARMVSRTLRTWTCSPLPWRGPSSRPPAGHFPLRRADGDRDRRWHHPAVRPWRRRPVRRPHGTRAHQPERRWGPPDRYRALSGLASSRGSCTRWRRIMIFIPKAGVAHARWKRVIGQDVYHTSKGPTVGREKGTSLKLEGEKHG